MSTTRSSLGSSKAAPLPTTSTSLVESDAVPTVTSSKPKRSWVGKLVVGMLLIMSFGSGWYAANARRDHQTKEILPGEKVSDARGTSPVTVTVEPVSFRTVQRTVEAFGTLHGFEEVSISARVEGRVARVFHDIADRVKPTELLLEIDPTDYALSVQQSDRALQVELAK